MWWHIPTLWTRKEHWTAATCQQNHPVTAVLLKLNYVSMAMIIFHELCRSSIAFSLSSALPYTTGCINRLSSMMLRAAASTSTRASTSALLCSECLHSISSSSSSTIRAQSTSAFGSRAATSSPSSNSSSGSDYAIPYDRGTSSSSSSRTSYNGTRNAQASGIRRDMRLSGKDWKSASSPNSSTSSRYNGQQQSQYQDRNYQYDRSSSQGSSTFRAGMRRDAPTRRDDTSQRSLGPSSSRHTSPNSQTTTYASSIPGQYSNSSNSTASSISSGHRGNIRSRSPAQSSTTTSSAAGTRSEFPTDKVVRQVNFGHGSALAAFASMKKAKQEQAQAKSSSSSSSPLPSSSSSVSASPAIARRRPDVPLQRKTPLVATRRRTRIPKKTVEIPSTVSVNALSQILGLKLRKFVSHILIIVSVQCILTLFS